jgi:DNA-binding MarR family transcriptional regulator
MMEPTTVIALRGMEKADLVRRVRSADDKRKAQVWLTDKAKRMRDELLGVARGVTEEAQNGISARDFKVFQRVIARMTANLDRHVRK